MNVCSIEAITKANIINRKIVVVKLQENQYLTFLVEDCKKPEVPGHPVVSLNYYKSNNEAQEVITQLYKKLSYWPKYPADGYYSKA